METPETQPAAPVRRQTYYERHRAKCLAASKSYYWSHREAYLEYNRQYFQEHKQELIQKHREQRLRRGYTKRVRTPKPKSGRPRGRPRKTPVLSEDSAPAAPPPTVESVLETIRSQESYGPPPPIQIERTPILVTWD